MYDQDGAATPLEEKKKEGQTHTKESPILGEKRRHGGKVHTTADSVIHAKRRPIRPTLALRFPIERLSIITMISPRLSLPPWQPLDRRFIT